jgi:hypothetical protein
VFLELGPKAIAIATAIELLEPLPSVAADEKTDKTPGQDVTVVAVLLREE